MNSKNVHIDASALYPKGHHPVREDMLPDFSGPAPVRRRRPGVPVVFIGFGLSSFHSPDGTSPRLVTGIYGRNQNEPELSMTRPYDPFKLDIFAMGQLIENMFVKVSPHRH